MIYYLWLIVIWLIDCLLLVVISMFEWELYCTVLHNSTKNVLSNCLLFFSINSFNWFIFTVFDLSIVVQCVHRTVFGGYRFAPDILQSWKSSAFARLQCSTLQFNGSGRMDQFTISVGPVRFLSSWEKTIGSDSSYTSQKMPKHKGNKKSSFSVYRYRSISRNSSQIWFVWYLFKIFPSNFLLI